MKPSILYGQPDSQYHAMRALSASMAFDIVQACPALAWHKSPFNPEREPEGNPTFDLGTATHLAILEPARLAERVSIIDAADYRTKAAQDLRDEAWRTGLLPLLWKDWQLVERMSRALAANHIVAQLLEGARTEVSFYWEDGEAECKARADIISADGRVIGDIKTAASASPAFFQRQAGNMGHDMRAAWYRAGWRLCQAIDWDGGWPAYKFIVVGKDEPHVVEVFELPEEDLETGHLLNRQAVETFCRCQEGGEWPSWGRGREMVVPLASWARTQRRAAAGLTSVPPGADDYQETYE